MMMPPESRGRNILASSPAEAPDADAAVPAGAGGGSLTWLERRGFEAQVIKFSCSDD